jgi:hypothetical protein
MINMLRIYRTSNLFKAQSRGTVFMTVCAKTSP